MQLLDFTFLLLIEMDEKADQTSRGNPFGKLIENEKNLISIRVFTLNVPDWFSKKMHKTFRNNRLPAWYRQKLLRHRLCLYYS